VIGKGNWGGVVENFVVGTPAVETSVLLRNFWRGVKAWKRVFTMSDKIHYVNFLLFCAISTLKTGVCRISTVCIINTHDISSDMKADASMSRSQSWIHSSQY